MTTLINPSPVVHERKDTSQRAVSLLLLYRRQLHLYTVLSDCYAVLQRADRDGSDGDSDAREPIDALEVFEVAACSPAAPKDSSHAVEQTD